MKQAGRYLAALNAVVESDKKLTGGLGFEGSLFLEFENGVSWPSRRSGLRMTGANGPRASRARSTCPWTAAEQAGGVRRPRSARIATARPWMPGAPEALPRFASTWP